MFAEDWDNLIILDACRSKAIESQLTNKEYFPVDRMTRKLSCGSTSHEFVRGNFEHKELDDVVYVSANGWYPILKDELRSEVFKYVSLHDPEHRTYEGLTTPPDVVTDRTIEVSEQHPHKRIVVHYLQPHQPYIGEFGRDTFEGRSDLLKTMIGFDGDLSNLHFAYDENLELVLEEVARLQSHLQGKSVITSDHGEFLGERSRPIPIREFGHPAGTYLNLLVEVPWITLEHQMRKDIENGEIDARELDADVESTEEQLEALGYKI